MNMQTKTTKIREILTTMVVVVALLVGAAGVGPLVSEAASASQKVDPVRNSEGSQRKISNGVDVLIGFNQTPGASEQALVRAFGGEISHSYHLVPAIAASVPTGALNGLRNHPLITVVEPDGLFYAIDAELDNTWGVKHIGAGDVHTNGNTGTGIKVAVIDSGIDYTHPELAANYVGGYDFVNNDSDPMDDHGHGTHVSGTVAAVKNGAGVVGAAPDASLYGLKVLGADGSGSFSSVISALQWATDNGIKITNNSYGSSGNPGTLVEEAFNNSATAGILHIAAAGNSGNCWGKGNNVGYPARYASVVAVAATNQSDVRPCFSSTGPAVELSAPGVSINSTKLGGGYVEFNGTSMASPHVAGAAALVIAAGISDTNGDGRINDEVRQVLNDTAEDLGDTGRDNKYGWGLVSAAAAVAAVGPTEPAVKVAVSTDKSNYINGEDMTAVLAAAVTDENGDVISGLDASSFATTLNGVAVAVTFSETATLGTYTGSLDISSLADGSYTVETIATDTRGVSGNGSATFTVGPAPTEATIASVNSINYATSGGKNNDKHLSVTAVVVDNLGSPVISASVSITLSHDSGKSWNGTGTTGTDGAVTFALKNAPSGCYETTVTNVVAEGLTWDGLTPTNGICK